MFVIIVNYFFQLVFLKVIEINQSFFKICFLIGTLTFNFNAVSYDLITSKSITQEIFATNKVVGLSQNKKDQKKYTELSSTRSCFNTDKYDSYIYELGKLYGVNPRFIKAIIASESCYNSKAISHKGAQGIMQLMPFTAKRFGVDDSFNPEQNILGGVKYLNFLQKRFKGNLELVAASYNAGEGAVDRFKGIPPYAETINYVKKVMSLYSAKKNIQNDMEVPRIAVSSKNTEKCKSNFKKQANTYLEVNKSFIRRFYLGSGMETYAQISDKTQVPFRMIEILNKKDINSITEPQKNKSKVLLWECELSD